MVNRNEINRNEQDTSASARSEFALVVVAYRSERFLLRCIRSLAEDGVYCSLIDNSGMSAPFKERLDKAHPHLRSEPFQGNLGYVPGVNFALTKLGTRRYSILGLVNPDTWFEPGWANGVRSAFARYPDFGILAPLQLKYAEGTDLARWTKAHLKANCLAHLAGRAVPIEVPVVEGSALFLRKEIVDDLEIHSPVFNMYYGDYDLCRRVRRAGWKVGIVPSIRYHHAGGVSSGGTKSQKYRLRLDRGEVLYLATDPARSQLRNAIKVTRFLYERSKEWLRGDYPSYPRLVVGGLKDLVLKRRLIVEKWQREQTLSKNKLQTRRSR